MKLRIDNELLSTFTEAQLMFPPTYRRLKREAEYSNKREQSPSYTDRILCHHNPSYSLVQLSYSSKE